MFFRYGFMLGVVFCGFLNVVRAELPDCYSPGNEIYYGGTFESQTSTFYIYRVVGPGTASEFDGGTQGGHLLNAQTYFQNGVLAENAWVAIRINAQGTPPTVVVKINGNSLPPTTSSVCVPAPSTWFMYPHRGSAPVFDRYNQQLNVAATAPTGAANQIEIDVTGGSPGQQSVDVLISQRAMAPVILVHGYHSGRWWWGPSPAPASVDPENDTTACGPDTGFNQDHHDQTKHTNRSGAFNFIGGLVSAKIPFSCAVSIPSLFSAVDGGAVLADQMQQIATQFGTLYVNLVGHSKGGLWIRDALPRLTNFQARIGVISVVTLDTPHYGSALADYVKATHQPGVVIPTNLQQVAAMFRKYVPSAEDDMTIAGADQFNKTHPDPSSLLFQMMELAEGKDYHTCYYNNTAQYFSVASDADLNGNGKIDSSSSGGDEGYDFARSNLVVNQIYQFLGKTHSATTNTISIGGLPVTTIVTYPTVMRTSNDIAVAVPNAQYDGFTSLSDTVSGGVWFGIPFFSANHRTVGCSGGTAGCAAGQNSPPDRPISIVVNAVIQAIQKAQQQVNFTHSNFPCLS
jgi:hypothetical protein